MNDRHYNIGQEFVAACNLLDLDPDRVLRRMGLPARSPQAPGLTLNLTAAQVALAFQQIVADYGRDDFHIRLADGFAKAPFGHPFLALQCSETLRKGIHRVAHFKRLIEPVDWGISESDGAFRIRLRALSPHFPLFGIGQIMSFLWLVKSCRNVTAKAIVPKRVLITDAVPHQAEIEADLGCPITVAGTAMLEFPAGLMDTPILSSNHNVIGGLDIGSSSTLITSIRDDQFLTSVHTIVLDLLPSGAVTLERVAAKLSLSKRTLERRLGERGSGFTEVLRECRLSMAQHYLQKTRMPIDEISLLLGYRETNSFYRAFKEWFGCTPQQARADHMHPTPPLSSVAPERLVC